MIELSISRPPTEQYDRTILSLLVFSSVAENINTTLFIFISIVLG